MEGRGHPRLRPHLARCSKEESVRVRSVCLCVWATQTTTGSLACALDRVIVPYMQGRQAHHTYLTQRSYGMMGEAGVGHSGVPAGDCSEHRVMQAVYGASSLVFFLVNQQQGNPSLLKTSHNILFFDASSESLLDSVWS